MNAPATSSPAHPAEVLAALTQAVATRPGDAGLWSQLGFLHMKLGEQDEALADFRTAQRLAPTLADAWFGEAFALFECGRQDEALAAIKLAIARAPGDQRLWSARAHILSALGSAPEEVLRAYRDWARRFADPLSAKSRPPQRPPTAGRRLRIGYLSGDFRRHALSYFFLPVLAAHDRTQFELFGFHTGAADERTPAFEQQFEHFFTVDRENDEKTAQIIANCQLDVLVDLSGHTDGNRLLALARRPAPVQITWYGYNCTTGMQAMDGRLSDAVMDPPGNEAWSSERLLRLPVFATYQPPADAPPVGELPAARNGHITFGSLNNPQKLTAATLTLWAELLAELPDARLLLIAPYSAEGEAANRPAFLQRLAAAGLPPERLDVLPRQSLDDFLRLNERVDVALETFPFSGGVTTCHTLWMGIPTVTLCGTLPFERAAAAVLSAAGLPELIAADRAAYKRICADLTVDRQILAKMRAGLRARLQASPLCDHVAQTRALEIFYRQESEPS